MTKRFVYNISCALGLVLAVASFSSCKDFLRVEPTNVQAVNTYDDVRKLLGGHLRGYATGYNHLRGTSIFFAANKDYLVTHFYSDDYDVSKYLGNWAGQNNQGIFLASLDWKHPSIHEEIWRNYYDNIGFYNMILAEVEQHPSASLEQQNQVRGEAKVLRALQFFRLVQLFSPYHIDRLGLPLNTDPDKIGTYDKRRQTQSENYRFILSELQEVLDYTTAPSESYNIFFDKELIHALLAQIYLYKGDSGAKEDGDYTKAIEHARAALASGISFESLDVMASRTDQVGYSRRTHGAMLTFIYTNETDRFQNVAGDSFYGVAQYPSDDLYQLFGDNDLRKAKYFAEDKSISKYSATFPYDFCQWNLFPASEQQLIIAESYARAGKETEALAALNEFTKYRYTTYTRPSGESVLESILKERRKEFCFDFGYRWLDLTRLQTGFRHLNVTATNANANTPQYYTLEDNDYRFCMPIPRIGELKDNPIEQNPQWGNF